MVADLVALTLDLDMEDLEPIFHLVLEKHYVKFSDNKVVRLELVKGKGVH